MNEHFPPEKRHRVLINSDAKNEADDQFAIVHALLSPSLEVAGLMPAHFGLHPGRPVESMEAGRAEMELLLRLMGLSGGVRLACGAARAMPDEQTAQPSAGAELIVEEAMKDDPRPLHVLFMGPLTDMASALLMEPRIGDRNIQIVWIGGAEGLTHYGREFNLTNDVAAANVVLRSRLPVAQIPYPLYGHFCVSTSELEQKVRPCGALGDYLVSQWIDVNAGSALAREVRSLGDSPAVGVVLAPQAGRWRWRPPPQYDPVTSLPLPPATGRAIRVYETYDARFLLEDFYAKLARFHTSGSSARCARPGGSSC